MSYYRTLVTEINELLDKLTAQKKLWHPEWVTHQICNNHKDGLAKKKSDHVLFWRHGGYATTRKLATEVINKRAGKTLAAATSQSTLPGFEYLQEYYVMERNGEDVGVHRDYVSDEEFEARASFYEKMSHALITHADEIRRFIRLRREGAAA